MQLGRTCRTQATKTTTLVTFRSTKMFQRFVQLLVPTSFILQCLKNEQQRVGDFDTEDQKFLGKCITLSIALYGPNNNKILLLFPNIANLNFYTVDSSFHRMGKYFIVLFPPFVVIVPLNLEKVSLEFQTIRKAATLVVMATLKK